MLRMAAVLLAITLSTPVQAASVVTGAFFDAGRPWKVLDAIAWREDDKLFVAISDYRLDRFAIADAGVVNKRIIRDTHQMRHRYSTAIFELDPNGEFRAFDSAGTPDLEDDRNPVGGWRLMAPVDGDRLQATWHYARSNLSIDVPITNTLAPPGSPAVNDSAPAKALLALLEARSKGDYETAMKLSAPPGHQDLRSPEKIAEHREQFQHWRPFAMRQAVVERVRIDGDSAEVVFHGKVISGSPSGRAFVVRTDGLWWVQHHTAR